MDTTGTPSSTHSQPAFVVKACCNFHHHLGDLLCHSPRHQPPHDVSHHDPPHTTLLDVQRQSRRRPHRQTRALRGKRESAKEQCAENFGVQSKSRDLWANNGMGPLPKDHSETTPTLSHSCPKMATMPRSGTPSRRCWRRAAANLDGRTVLRQVWHGRDQAWLLRRWRPMLATLVHDCKTTDHFRIQSRQDGGCPARVLLEHG